MSPNTDRVRALPESRQAAASGRMRFRLRGYRGLRGARRRPSGDRDLAAGVQGAAIG